MTQPGWYKDPVDPEVQRYWDGEGWLGEPIPASDPTPDGPPEGAEAPDWSKKPDTDAPSSDAPSSDAAQAEAGGPPAPVAWPPAAPWTPDSGTPTSSDRPGVTGPGTPASWTSPIAAGTPLPQGAVVLPPGTPVPPGGFKPGQLPPGAIILPPGTPLPPGLLPQGSLPSGAVQVLLPPQIATAGQGVVKPHGRPIAGLGARLLARLVDIAIVGLLNAAVTGWFIYQWLQEVAPYWREYYHRLQNQQSTGDLVAPERQGYLQVVILILIAALWFAYEVPSIANNGQTVGKRLLKIKVMRLESEEPIGFGRAIRRWNPLGLSVLLWTCGVGFLLQFLDSLSPVIDWPLHRAFHDRSAGTVVVAADPVPTEPAGEPR